METEIINYKKKDMITLTNEEIKFYENQKQCHICKKGFFRNKKDKFKHIKVRDHCHYTGKFRGAAHSIWNLRFSVPKKISIIIHNRSTYDDDFIIKQLPEKFEGKFKCLGENTEEYITYSVPIKKEVANDDDHNDDDDGKFYRWLSFVDSCRLMLGKLSDFVDNLSGIHDKECKKWIARKEIRSECQFIGCKTNRLKSRCTECKKLCFKSPNKAIENFPILYQFCKGEPNNFFLLLGKGYYSYEDADSCGKFDETTILSKEDF